MIKQLPAFPAAPFYSGETASLVRSQFRLQTGLIDEISGATEIKLHNAARYEDQSIVTDLDGIYEFDCPYFGAGDYTVEAKITFLQLGTSAGHYILGQYMDGAAVTDRNSWNFRLTNLGVLVWYERRGAVTLNTPTTVSAQRFVFQLNREYHVVAERVGSTLTLYVDGELYATMTTAAPLTNSPVPVRSQVFAGSTVPGYGACSRRIRDIRIAAKAMYHGAIYNNFKGVQTLPTVLNVNHLTFDSVSVNNGVTSTDGVLDFGVGDYLSIPDNPDFAFLDKDFEIDIEFMLRSTPVSIAGGAITNLLSWNPWSHAPIPCNYVLSIQHQYGALVFSTSNSSIDDSVRPVWPFDPQLNVKYRIVLKRVAGFITLYVNNSRVGEAKPFPLNITHKIGTPMLIGRNYGGGTGQVHWDSDMVMSYLRIRKAPTQNPQALLDTKL